MLMLCTPSNYTIDLKQSLHGESGPTHEPLRNCSLLSALSLFELNAHIMKNKQKSEIPKLLYKVETSPFPPSFLVFC